MSRVGAEVRYRDKLVTICRNTYPSLTETTEENVRRSLPSKTATVSIA